MEEFTFLQSGLECQTYMLNKIKEAKNVIFISSWYIDITFKLNNKPLYKLLIDKCNQGVKVYILTSSAPYGDLTFKKIYLSLNHKHKNFHFKILDMESNNYFFNAISSITNNFKFFYFKKCCNRLFHQRYFNVDNKFCMLGGVDMSDELNCSLLKKKCNINQYYWVEYGIIFKPQKEFIEYCINNFNSNGKAELISPYFFGNFYNKNTEYLKLINLIKKSKNHIFIENQWIYSTSKTKNKIINHVCDKLIKDKNINVTIITNNIFIDVCNHKLTDNILGKIVCNIYSCNFRMMLYSSLKFIYYYLRENGLSDEDINNRIKIYINTENMYIHSKNIIIDHDKMLYGTSNLWERSYSKGKDLELSIFLKGNKVKEVEEKIINSYRGNVKLINISKIFNKPNYNSLLITIIILILIVILFNNI